MKKTKLQKILNKLQEREVYRYFDEKVAKAKSNLEESLALESLDKISLTNKHLSEKDYVKVNCSPTSTTLDIYNSIARQLDIEILESHEVTTTVGGEANYRDWETDRKSTRLNSSHRSLSRMPSSA